MTPGNGCACDLCTVAAAAYEAEHPPIDTLAALGVDAASRPAHLSNHPVSPGTYARYGCRCGDCARLAAVDQAARRATPEYKARDAEYHRRARASKRGGPKQPSREEQLIAAEQAIARWGIPGAVAHGIPDADIRVALRRMEGTA